MPATVELFSALELTARRLIEEYRTARGADIFITEVALLNVWTAQWSAALPVEQIVRVGEALNNCSLGENVPKALTMMVRAKLLRSFVSRGVRYYEVNF